MIACCNAGRSVMACIPQRRIPQIQCANHWQQPQTALHYLIKVLRCGAECILKDRSTQWGPPLGATLQTCESRWTPLGSKVGTLRNSLHRHPLAIENTFPSCERFSHKVFACRLRPVWAACLTRIRRCERERYSLPASTASLRYNTSHNFNCCCSPSLLCTSIRLYSAAKVYPKINL